MDAPMMPPPAMATSKDFMLRFYRIRPDGLFSADARTREFKSEYYARAMLRFSMHLFIQMLFSVLCFKSFFEVFFLAQRRFIGVVAAA